MKNIILITFILAAVTSCNAPKRLYPIYSSSCSYLGEYNPLLKIAFKADSFTYRNNIGNLYSGHFIRRKDSLYLYSVFFVKQAIEFEGIPAPTNQYTDNDGFDIYLIKGRKLYPINRSGLKGPCYLIEQSKWKKYVDKIVKKDK